MNKKNQLIQQLLSAVLFVAVLVMLGWLSNRYKTEFDWTAGNRNTLTAASAKQLAAMPDEIKVYAFAYSTSDDRRALEQDLQRYTRVKKNIAVEFIDPSAQPQKVREFNVQQPGEIVIEYQGRRENLRGTTEPQITGVLQRLAYSGEQWVGFLEGHGERSTVDAQSQSSFTKFAQVLGDKGLKIQPVNLIKTAHIPDNLSVLVIASPESALLAGEIQLVDEFVQKGGNLLWLADPDYAPGLAPLAKTLGISWQNGYAIFPEYQILGTGHPGFYVATEYPPNAVTQGMDQVTLFPLVRSLSHTDVPGWQAQPLLTSSKEAWLETGKIEGALQLDGNDIPGPLTIGLTLTREQKNAEGKPYQQRVALIGDADFLSNAYLGELGNQQLGLNLIQWLASRDAQLNIDVPKAPDSALFLPTWGMALIVVSFVLALPLLLIGWGVTRWIIRRRK